MKTYYKEACMCRSPMPSRFDRSRCAWCGGILPPSVRVMYAIEQELDGMASSQHDPNPPSLSAPYEVETGGAHR